MNTARKGRPARIHQVVFRWTDRHLLGGRGMGPVGTSLDEEGLARWGDRLSYGDLLQPLHPDRPAIGLLRPRSWPDRAAVVRVDAVPTSTRGSHQLHALVGPAALLDARTALGLLDWDGWLPPADGPLPEPELAPLTPQALTAAAAAPARPESDEVAALVRHVLHRPERAFHFAGARSDPYALAFGLAAVLDVSLLVEGDLYATAAQPQIVVTRDKTSLRLRLPKGSRKTPGGDVPLPEQADDVAARVRAALDDPRRTSPQPPEDLARGLADLRRRREGLFRLLQRAVEGDAQARAHLVQDDTLGWVREQLPRLGVKELSRLCRSWYGWGGAEALAALLRERSAELALDWEDTPERDELRAEAQKLFSYPSPYGISPERKIELRAVPRRLAALWSEAPDRSPGDVAALLWQAFTLARLSHDELHDILLELEPPTDLLVLVAERFAGRHEAEEVRRGLLEALLARRVSLAERSAVREALLTTDFLLDVLEGEDPDTRAQLFGWLLRGAYGSAEDNRADPERPWRLYEDLRAVAGHPGFHFVLPAVARVLGDVDAQLRLWYDLRGTPAGREAAALLDGVAEHLMEILAAPRSLAEFRNVLDVLVELRRFDALPRGDLDRWAREHHYLQRVLHGLRGADQYGEIGVALVHTFADLVWLASGQLPDPDWERRLPDSRIGELEKAELSPDPAYFRLALIRLSRTRDEPTAASDRLWRGLPPRLRESFRDRPELMDSVGEPPVAAPASAKPKRRGLLSRLRRDPGSAPELSPGPADSPNTPAGAEPSDGRGAAPETVPTAPPTRHGGDTRHPTGGAEDTDRLRQSDGGAAEDTWTKDSGSAALPSDRADTGWFDDLDGRAAVEGRAPDLPPAEPESGTTESGRPRRNSPLWKETQRFATTPVQHMSGTEQWKGPLKKLFGVFVLVLLLSAIAALVIMLNLMNRDIPAPPPVQEETASVGAPPG